MKYDLRDACIHDQLPCSTISLQIGEEKIVLVPHTKSLKDVTPEERKKDASKPIYLVRYE